MESSLKALTPGIAYVNFAFPGFPFLNKNKKLLISDVPDEFEVSASIVTASTSILPRKNYRVRKQELSEYIDRIKPGYISGRDFVSIADALVSILLKEGYGTAANSFRFRQDEFGGNNLYLWQLGKNYEYIYGWGGTYDQDSYTKTWVAVLNSRVFANGLDTIEVKPQDVLCFRHVTNIRDDWSLIQLVPDKQATIPRENIGFTVKQLSVTRNQNNEFSVSGPFLLPDAKVLVNSNPVLQNNSLLVSDYSGEFSLQFNSGGRYYVGIDNSSSEAAEINVINALGDQDLIYNSIEVFPNPFIDDIHLVPGGFNIRQINLYTIEGKLIIKTMYNNEDSFSFNPGTLQEGVYIIEIWLDDRKITKKIIKSGN